MAETRVGIVANTGKPGTKGLLARLDKAFDARGIAASWERATAEFAGKPDGKELPALADGVDLIAVLGGDGTILHVVHQLREKLKPLAAINVGTLGFLTCATSDELETFVDVIAEGTYLISPRSILKIEVGGGDGEKEVVYGLNEAAVSRCDICGVISLETRINGAFFSEYSGDGLIVATPTGSTAYSFSAGGAIVEPGANVFVVTPICPHALTNRSMVVPDQSEIRVVALSGENQAVLTVDGRYLQRVGPDTRLVISRAPFDLALVMLPGQTFYQILQQKLRWHGSNR